MCRNTKTGTFSTSGRHGGACLLRFETGSRMDPAPPLSEVRLQMRTNSSCDESKGAAASPN